MEQVIWFFVNIPEGIEEYKISDYLSELTGFCHKGYTLEKLRHWKTYM